MKKLVSAILALSLIFTLVTFTPVMANEPSDSYANILYEEYFDSAINTTDKTTIYWNGDPSVSNGALSIATASNIYFPATEMPTAESGEQLVVEMRIKYPSKGQLFVVEMKDANATAKNVFGAQAYNENIISRNESGVQLVKSVPANTWCNMKLIYDPVDGKWDVIGNGVYTQKDIFMSGSSAFENASISKIAFTNSAVLDYIRIYSHNPSNNNIQLDFDEEATNASFCEWNAVKTNGKVELTVEDGRECLVLDKPSTNEEVKLDLNIPTVYATSENPYIVVETKFKVTGGQNTGIIAISGNTNGGHLLTDIRNYNNFFYVRDPASGGSAAYKIKEGFSADEWYYVQFIFDTTDATAVKFDVYVDGELALENVPATIATANCINKLSFYKNSTAAESKLFIDEVNVYNATEDIVTGFSIEGEATVNVGESKKLVVNAKGADGSILSNTVKYALKDEYRGATVSEDGTVTVAENASKGAFEVVASTVANGILYEYEFECKCEIKEETYSYGKMLYEENFDSSLNTTNSAIPMWNGDGIANEGVLSVSSATNLYFPAIDMPSAASGEKIAVEMKVKLYGTSGNPINISAKDAANTEKLSFSSQIYGGKLILRNQGSRALITGLDSNKWYTLKLIYNPADGKWDGITDGKIMQKAWYQEQLTGGSLSKIALSGRVDVDSIKVYSTKNVVDIDFNEKKAPGSFYSPAITKTSGKVELVEEDDRKALLVEQVDETEKTALDLTIPTVYATENNPFVVAEARFKSVGGNGTEIQISGNSGGQHSLLWLRNYDNNLLVRDPESASSAKYTLTDNFDSEKWYSVQFVFDMSNPASIKYDAYINGKRVLEDVPSLISSADCINKLSFIKNSGVTASKLFVDDIKVYNATEAIISDIECQSKTAYAPGENLALSAVVKDSAGNLIDKAVSYELLRDYDGIEITDGNISVSADAQPGLFTVVATAAANGTEFSKEIIMKVTDSKNPYRILTSSVTDKNVVLKIADYSAVEAKFLPMIAVYDAAGVTLKKVVPCTPSFRDYVWSTNVSLNKIAEEGDTVKVFFWNDITIAPYFAELSNK